MQVSGTPVARRPDLEPSCGTSPSVPSDVERGGGLDRRRDVARFTAAGQMGLATPERDYGIFAATRFARRAYSRSSRVAPVGRGMTTRPVTFSSDENWPRVRSISVPSGNRFHQW